MQEGNTVRTAAGNSNLTQEIKVHGVINIARLMILRESQSSPAILYIVLMVLVIIYFGKSKGQI
jgi:hypothetical protein